MQENLITEAAHCSFKDLWILVLLSNVCNKCVFVFVWAVSKKSYGSCASCRFN